MSGGFITGKVEIWKATNISSLCYMVNHIFVMHCAQLEVSVKICGRVGDALSGNCCGGGSGIGIGISRHQFGFDCWEVVFGEEDKNLRLQNSEFDALNSPSP